MALVSAKDVDKFNVKLVEGGNSKEFALNSSAALAPKHEDLTQLAASIATGMYSWSFSLKVTIEIDLKYKFR